MEQRSMSEASMFWVKKNHVLPTTPSYKNVFFSHNCLPQILEPVLFYMTIVFKFLLALHTIVLKNDAW
jgi:hypothetical protein